MLISWSGVGCCLSVVLLYLLRRSYGRDAEVLRSVVRAGNMKDLGSYCWQITVVCISKGERNHQPSSREQAMADYVFYRFFDVGNCTLSDQLPEKIAGQEVNVLLNPKDEQVTSCSDQGVRGMNQKVDEGPIATVPLPQSAVKEDESPVASLLQFPFPSR